MRGGSGAHRVSRIITPPTRLLCTFKATLPVLPIPSQKLEPEYAANVAGQEVATVIRDAINWLDRVLAIPQPSPTGSTGPRGIMRRSLRLAADAAPLPRGPQIRGSPGPARRSAAISVTHRANRPSRQRQIRERRAASGERRAADEAN
jgi:hypothetical protein